jgi:hypothetical protein
VPAPSSAQVLTVPSGRELDSGDREHPLSALERPSSAIEDVSALYRSLMGSSAAAALPRPVLERIARRWSSSAGLAEALGQIE